MAKKDKKNTAAPFKPNSKDYSTDPSHQGGGGQGSLAAQAAN